MITVADCLRLPALRDAEVIAGAQGLDQYVSTVSVLEYARIFAMADQLFLGNELILTALTSVMDDVEAQCTAIRRLHETGEAGVVLYYIGYFLPSVDQRLIDTADALGFPLIVMPPNTYHHRYSEVITEVLSRIFEDQKKETRFVPILLNQIAKMRERQRNISGVLRLLSDRVRCSFLLLSRDGRECGLATWPMAVNEEFVDQIRDIADRTFQTPAHFPWQQKDYSILPCLFDTEAQKGFRLYMIGESGAMDQGCLSQAAEVLQTSYNIWQEDLRKPEADDLVRVILNDQQGDAYRIAGSMHIDLKQLRVMWVLRSKSAASLETDQASAQIKQTVKEYLQDSRKTAVVDTFDSGIVVFMDDAKYLELDKELGSQFMDAFRKAHPDTVLIWCGGLDSIQDARLAYIQIEEYCSTACAIYPHRDIFTQRELSFSKSCYSVVREDPAVRDRYLSILKPLCGQKDERDVLETLAAYLIDADKSTGETAALLHVHESTVKYRLNKIEQRLGYDIGQMPGTYELYLASAVRRLLTQSSEQT